MAKLPPPNLHGEIRIPFSTIDEGRAVAESLSQTHLWPKQAITGDVQLSNNQCILPFTLDYQNQAARRQLINLAREINLALKPNSRTGCLTLYNSEQQDGVFIEIGSMEVCNCGKPKLLDNNSTIENGVDAIRRIGLSRAFTYLVNEEKLNDVKRVNMLFSFSEMKPTLHHQNLRELASAAIHSENEEMIDYLLEHGWEQLLGDPDTVGFSLLAYACGVSEQMTRHVLSKRNWTPEAGDLAHELSLAAREGSPQILDLLVEAGFDPTELDEQGYSLAQWTVRGVNHSQRSHIIEWLFDYYPETFETDKLPPDVLDPTSSEYRFLSSYLQKLELQKTTGAVGSRAKPTNHRRI